MSVAGRRLTFRREWPSFFASAETSSDDAPGRLALLWALVGLLSIASTVVFFSDNGRYVSSSLALSGATVFAGLVAAWALGLKRSTLPLLSAFLAVRLVAGLAGMVLRLITSTAYEGYVGASLGGLQLAATALIIYLGYRTLRSRRRRVAAIVLALAANLGAIGLLSMDGVFWRMSYALQPLLGRQVASSATDDEAPEIDDDLLWGAQRSLIEKEGAGLKPRVAGGTNVYAMAVAGSGTQALFSREAHEALRVAALHFGSESRGGALLSNGAADLMHTPLATRASIADVAHAIGEKADHKRDLLFVYLASHGSRTAELASELPNARSVQPISAATTAAALRDAGVARRVIVVSACFSATWIPALADDNTIVITAAAKDRTSFGCDDTRRLTVFGDAFLGSLAARGVSLHDAFENAKRKISAEETNEKVTPSLPQAFVGRKMQSLWLNGA